MTAALAVLAAVALDRALGEPARWHPLVGFGRLAQRLESRLRGPADEPPWAARAKGAAAWALLLAPWVAGSALLNALPFQVLFLYLAIGAESLGRHGEAVAAALEAGDLDRARSRVALLVSRDTEGMDETQVARAAVESVLENGNDAVFGVLLWFALLGGPGAVLYRLANTLDAMWGYRTPRYLHFGWAAARLDDLLNLAPARLTALSYALLGNFRAGWRCWRRQAGQWYSPNAGPVMAAGAGALGLALGGPARYHGVAKPRPVLGEGRAPAAGDIRRALALVQRALWAWVLLALLEGWISV